LVMTLACWIWLIDCLLCWWLLSGTFPSGVILCQTARLSSIIGWGEFSVCCVAAGDCVELPSVFDHFRSGHLNLFGCGPRLTGSVIDLWSLSQPLLDCLVSPLIQITPDRLGQCSRIC
jgi:hypothetical protein